MYLPGLLFLCFISICYVQELTRKVRRVYFCHEELMKRPGSAGLDASASVLMACDYIGLDELEALVQ
jgi:hypothetical protein